MMFLPGLLLSIFVAAAAQPEESGPKRVRYEDLPPAAQLGVRVEAVQRAWPTSSSVVIVPSTADYIAAIASWTPLLRFPVLLDDGTPQAREDIARFVRGFRPASVYRWRDDGQAAPLGPEAVSGAVRSVWARAIPGEAEGPRLENDAELWRRWRVLGVPPSGVVVASMEDPAWTAALALAAGRAQPLVWVPRPPGNIGATFTRKAIADFSAAVERLCESRGLRWAALGDDVDAVTLCMSVPSRVEMEPGVILATTDVLGRVREGESPGVRRWAWAGQIMGSEARSAYTAMCALFLHPSKAWLFDGYPTSEPWSKFSMRSGVDYLQRVGIEATVDEHPRGSEASWRRRAASPIDAGLILINTKGMANEFHLEPGRCLPGDVPFLQVPAMLHLVHSWSALGPSDRDTLGGRWLERGVHCYLGSVDEPFLHAFVPSSIVVGRLVSKYPFGAAVRIDDAPAWKLACFGDPLAMLSNPAPRREDPPPLEGARSLADELAAALRDGDMAIAIRALVLLGRDRDAADLVRGLWTEDPDTLTPQAMEDAILSLYRAGEIGLMVRVFDRLPPGVASRPDFRDALWHATFPGLEKSRDVRLLRLLRRSIRPESRLRDVLEIADPFAAAISPDAAVEMLAAEQALLGDPSSQKEVDAAMARVTRQRR